MIRVFLTGAHMHRTPLSYPALWPLFKDYITHVDSPEKADLYVFAHVLDIQDAPNEMIEDWRRRRRPVILFSEEPFWDTIWCKHPLERNIFVDTAFGTVPVHQLNHHTSDIFQFDHLPYYLLTNHRFANAYAHRFARNAKWTVRDWRDRLAAAPVDVGFMFERRPEPYHAVKWPDGDIIGLCSWRTELAQACRVGQVERWGQSWQGGPSRFELDTDWHIEKLVRLDGRSRILGAIENTHQPNYITEKIFDALACGSLPLYYASPRHRIHEFRLLTEAWINLYDLTPVAAAALISEHRCTEDTADALSAASAQMAQLFSDIAVWQHERQRLALRVRSALSALL